MESIGTGASEIPPENYLESLAIKRLRNARILWSALAAWMSLYGYAAFQFTKTSLSLTEIDTSTPLLRAFVVPAIVVTVAAWLVPVVVVRRAEKRATSILKARFTSLIYRLAFLLSVCMMGFAVAMATHNGNLILPFFLISLIGYGLSFPTRQSLALTPSELLRFESEKIVYPPASLLQKIFGWVVIAIGVLDGSVGGYATMLKYRHSIFDDDYLLRFGKMDTKLVFLGILVLNRNRLRVKSPMLFWVFVALFALASLPGFLGLLRG